MSLTKLAQQAVADHRDCDIEVAMAFFQPVLPRFVGTSNDRLIKAGRNLVATTRDLDGDKLEQSLALLVEECRVLVEEPIKVPTVPFGQTGLHMPIVTLGCMRFQQEWGPRITTMNQVGGDCQDNLVAILRQAIAYGMVHIETARAYGCSELQLGVALKQLMQAGEVRREDLIIQTKVPPHQNPADFRAALETSFRNLQVDYVDLFALHGMNFAAQLDWVFGNKDGSNCWHIMQEYVRRGKIRHVGFSTHHSTDQILRLLEHDVWDYANIHYHYFGSYTASGGGVDGRGNLHVANVLASRNMGTFIISPFDKGGRGYAPSVKLRALTLPEMEPMTFMSQWIWNHHALSENGVTLPRLHTYTCGAARPSDLDQPAVAAYWQARDATATLHKVRTVTQRLDRTKLEALGADWVQSWWRGLPKALHSKYHVEHNQIVWIYNNIVAFGMYDFGQARYKSFESNSRKWDDSKTDDENIGNIGRNSWGFVPGLPLRADADYSDDLAEVPPANATRVSDAEQFVLKWCATNSSDQSALHHPELPHEWTMAYDMRPWPDYPDQPSRST